MNYSIEKWKKAAIHLECATDSESIDDYFRSHQEARELLSNGDITNEEFLEILAREQGSRDIRYNGTAVFLKANNKRYLITARHVLWDELEAERLKDRDKDWPVLQEVYNRYAASKIFNIIFRVPSFDEVKQSSDSTDVVDRIKILMNLGAGTESSTPYTFSVPELDLAIISLDGDVTTEMFADGLERSGYIPIELDDISTNLLKEGEDVMAVGFPAATSVIGQMELSEAEYNWASNQFSVPVFAFGKVSMYHEDLNFFWTDMSIYPGNSGGAVVAGDKLVGIVSAQALIPVDGAENIFTRIPFGKIIKAKYLFDLLAEQDDKDQRKRSFFAKS